MPGRGLWGRHQPAPWGPARCWSGGERSWPSAAAGVHGPRLGALHAAAPDCALPLAPTPAAPTFQTRTFMSSEPLNTYVPSPLNLTEKTRCMRLVWYTSRQWPPLCEKMRTCGGAPLARLPAPGRAPGLRARGQQRRAGPLPPSGRARCLPASAAAAAAAAACAHRSVVRARHELAAGGRVVHVHDRRHKVLPGGRGVAGRGGVSHWRRGGRAAEHSWPRREDGQLLAGSSRHAAAAAPTAAA
jgi:hypothetical protein